MLRSSAKTLRQFLAAFTPGFPVLSAPTEACVAGAKRLDQPSALVRGVRSMDFRDALRV